MPWLDALQSCRGWKVQTASRTADAVAGVGRPPSEAHLELQAAPSPAPPLLVSFPTARKGLAPVSVSLSLDNCATCQARPMVTPPLGFCLRHFYFWLLMQRAPGLGHNSPRLAVRWQQGGGRRHAARAQRPHWQNLQLQQGRERGEAQGTSWQVPPPKAAGSIPSPRDHRPLTGLTRWSTDVSLPQALGFWPKSWAHARPRVIRNRRNGTGLPVLVRD